MLDSVREARSWRIGQAARHIARGGVVAYPTEAVWGLGCDPFDAAAVSRLLALKHRAADKGLILIASRVEQLGGLAHFLSASQLQQLTQCYDQPTTWLIPHYGKLPNWITGGRDTVAIRFTQHPVARALCEQSNRLLVSTSANLAGFAPARTQAQVRRYFGRQIDAYVSGTVNANLQPSRIIDLQSGAILR